MKDALKSNFNVAAFFERASRRGVKQTLLEAARDFLALNLKIISEARGRHG